MTRERRYLITQTIANTAINTAMSVGAAAIIFGHRNAVPLWGLHGLALDFGPQSFIITLMSMLMPTINTRKQVRAGKINRTNTIGVALPRNPFARGLSFAVPASILFTLLGTALLATFFAGPYALGAVITVKICISVLLSVLVTPVSVVAALADEMPS